MSRLNLHHLRLFRAVARDGTLSSAARHLNISQSAVSTQVKALEASLGQALFERKGRRLILTEAGRIALDHANEIHQTAEHLQRSLKSGPTRRSAIRIGALATLSRNFQIGFVAPVMGRADVEVIFHSGDQEQLLRGLESMSLDVVLTNLVPARDAASPYLVTRLAEQPVSLVGAPVPPHQGLEMAHKHAKQGRSLSELLSSEPLILPSLETPMRAAIDALFERLGIMPRIAAEADDMALLRLLACHSPGLAILPPVVVQNELQSGALIEWARLEDVQESFFAVTLQRRFPNPILRELLGEKASITDP